MADMEGNNDQGRLARIEELLKHLTARMEERIAHSDRWRLSIERMLKGDGNGYRGMLVRLDRLEQAADRQRWLIRSLWTALIPLALKAAWDLLAH